MTGALQTSRPWHSYPGPRIALSYWQPWAWLLVNGHFVQPDGRVTGFKDIENRDWPTPFRGRHYVHASKKLDMSICEMWLKREPPFDMPGIPPLPGLGTFVLGAVIGEVDIVGCVEEHPSRWFFGRYGFLLNNPVTYPEPVPVRGMQKFWSPKELVS